MTMYCTHFYSPKVIINNLSSFFGCTGVPGYAQAFSSCSEQGLLFSVRGLLAAVASPAVEHRLQVHVLQ